MTNFNELRKMRVVGRDSSLDQGLRSYMSGVYGLMGIGMVVTALVAYVIYTMAITTQPPIDGQLAQIGHHGVYLTNFGRALFFSPLRYVIMFAPLAVVFGLQFSLSRISASAARFLFVLYAALVGASLSSLFLVYANSTIFEALMLTAVLFGGLSLYGYTTKRDLRPFGTFMFMAVWGVFFASLLNMWMHSSALQFGINIFCILLFSGLTAYDTQMIKAFYYEYDDNETMGKKVVLGALNLYIDFINIFISILQLLGATNRDDN